MKNIKRSALSKALVYAAITGMVSFGSYAYAQDINAYDNLTSPAAVRKYVNTHRYKRINKPQFVFNKSSLQSAASRGGSITGFAAPTTPTIDYLNTKVSGFMSDHNKYTLSTTQGTNTHFIIINGTQYWYTPSELTQEKNNVLNYLTGCALTTTDATAENHIYRIKNGDETYTYYTFDTTNLPKSAYTISEVTSTDNWNWTDGTKYYKLNFTGDSSRATNGVTLFDTEPAEATGKTKGRLTVKLPNNENREIWYQYDTSRTENVERVNDTLNTADTDNKVFAGFSGSANGGAIYNTQNLPTKVINSDFVGNSSSSSSSSSYGGAIYNSGTISSITGDFIDNSVSSSTLTSSYGGAISNFASSGTASIGSIVGDFVGNSSYSSYSYGGAISNNAGGGTASIGSIVGDFVGNYVSSSSSSSSYGGAISNYVSSGTASIGSIVGDFVGNSSDSYSSGGAISNYVYFDGTASIGSIVGDFIDNISSDAGGAIFNLGTIGSISGKFTSNSVNGYNNSSGYQGGAISNNSTIDSIDGYFTGNSVTATDDFSAHGGAISNLGWENPSIISSIKGDFVGNYAKAASGSYGAYGGAIFNGKSYGIPVYDEYTQITLVGNTFTDNYVQVGETETPNSIYNAGVINIAADKTVTINDGYDGLSEAQLNIGTGSTFNLSVDNGVIQTDNLGTVTNNGTINWDLDVDFGNETQKSDLITINDSSILGSGILIRSINLKTDPTSEYTVNIAGGSALANALNIAASGGVLKTQGSSGWWDVTYTSEDGLLHFAPGEAPILDSLAIKVHTGDPAVRTYTMTAPENVGENLGTLANATDGTKADLTVDGGGFAINGGTYTGITVDDGQKLTFTNVSDVTGFANDTAVTNGGTLNITDSKFTSKIANNASMTLNGTNALNGAVSGANGETVISTGTTTVGADFTQKDLTVESGAGLNIAANNLNITNTVKNDGTITLQGGATDSYVTLGSSIGNKTESVTTAKTVIDGFVNVNYNNSGDQKTIAQAIEINLGKALRANVKSVGGSVTNDGSLAIYGYEDQTDTTFNQAVTGTGTTTITRKVNVDSSIANNIIIDKFDGTSPAETHYADITVGNNGILGASGKTITVNDGNKLTMNTGAIASGLATFTNEGELVLNNSSNGSIGIAIGATGSGDLKISTTGTDADNVVVTANHAITNQDVTVEKGIFQLGTGASLAGTSAVVVNSDAGMNSINGAINDYTTGNTITLADGARVYVDITGNGTTAEIDKFIADENSTIKLSNLNVLGAVNIPTGEVQLLSAGKVEGESLFIQSEGKTVAVQGTGRSDGSIRVGMTPTSDKLNGAVYVSGAVDAITYSITDEHGETVNNNSQPALGHIKDSFKIQSGDTTQKTITATGGTKGIIVDENKKLTLDNVKFENFATGEVNSTTYPVYNGDYQGIITNYGTLKVKDSYFAVSDGDGNTNKIAIANYGTLTSDPSVYEGGVMNYRGASFTVEGDTFQNINRTGKDGGAIYNEAAEGSTPAGTLYVQKDASDRKTKFVDNRAANGGAIYNAGTATISDAVFGEIDVTDPANPVSHGNTAGTSGGAIYNIGTMSITNSSFEGNSAGYGGAIYNAGGHEINVTGSTFSNNTASNFGGAVANQGTAKFIDSNFSNNSANGGAIFNEGGGSVYIIASESNSLFENNKFGDTPNDISNLGNLYLQAKDGKTITLNGGIVGDTGTTNIGGTYNDGADKKYTGNVIIGNALTQTNLVVEDSAKMSIAANNLNITNTVQNDGTITLTGGTTDNNVTLSSSIANKTAAGTTGKTVIDGFVSIAGGKTISQAIEVLTDRRLTANANSIKGAVDNSGKVILTGGELTNNISGANGEVNITTGTVTNSASISAKSVVINSTLNTLADKVIATDGITNTGTLELTGNNLASAISGAGVTKVIGTVTNTAAKEIGNALEITNPGSLTTTTNTLTSATTTKNAGTLVFNNTADGTLNQSITDNGTHGTVEIATTNGAVIDMTGKTITNNIIKLTSGTLKVTGDNGNVNLTGADKIEANGGTLNVQDGKMGTIQLGTVDTATNSKNLNVAIDADFMHGTTRNDRGIVGTADVINATSVTGSNKIHVSNISLVVNGSEINTNPVRTEFTAKIASGAAANAMDVSSTTTTITSYRDDVGNILLDYTVDSAGDGYLTGRHSTLDDAITSSVDNKMYFMDSIAHADDDATITGPKTLNGNSLAITTNGNNISLASSAAAGSDGIIIGNASRTLSIIGTNSDTTQPNTTISGFGTAINNTAGGRVNLTDVTMTNNTKDIVNDGHAAEKGVYLAGTNNINSIVDSDGSHTHGQTTVETGGTSTIGTIQQKSVTVAAGATANLTNVDNVATGDGITNDGDLVLAGGTADAAATNNNVIKKSDTTTGNAKTTIAAGSNITNAQTMTQKEVVLSAATTTPAADAAQLTNNSTINADTINVNDGATLNNNSNIAATDGSSVAAVNVKANADLNLNKNSNSKANVTLDADTSDLTITDNGVLTGGVKSSNGGSINLVADTQDISMSNAIREAITGADGTGDGSYIVTATSTPKTAPATVNTVTIDKAIAGATAINVDGNTDAIVTNVATASNPTAPINVGSNGNLTFRNDSATDDMTVANAIQKATGATSGYDVNTANTNADTTITVTGNITDADNVNTNNNTVGGTTALAGNVNAADVTNKSGTLDIASGSSVSATNAITNKSGVTNINALVNTPTISSKGTGPYDTVNINGNGDTSTSDKIGSANINIADDASVTVNTDSSAYTLNNAVAGETADSAIVLNGTAGTPSSPTDVGTQFNIASAINGGTVELANGQLNLPNESVLTNADGLRIDSGATLNTINNETVDYNTVTTFADGAQLKIDANVYTKKTDKFTNATEGAGEKLTDISVQGLDKIYNTTSVNLTSNTGLSKLQAGDGLADLISGRYNKIVTPVRILRGQVTQSGNDLLLQFVPKGEGYKSFNSAVLAAPIAAQMGGYLNQLHSYDEAFRNMDMYMLMTKEQRQAMKMKNHYATTSKDLIYDATTNQYENKAGWFRPYATFENVGLDNGPNVSNVAYGSYAGGESEMYDLGHGWDGMWGVYVGYNGSHQTYGYGNSIYQNGGTLGLVGMAYKDNFFTGLTVNAGANGAEASTMYGSENFAMLMAGIASKSGYNWELANGKFIIQPNATISYSFVNTFDYRNAAGINISSDPLHAIQIEPGIKFIGNLKNGWQPYASVSMVWNIMDKTHFHANEVALPDMSVKPFVKYGVGVRKSWGERFTAFFQTYFTNGGRNGVGLQAGFRWTLGKGSSKSGKAKTSNTKEIKKTVIKSQNVASK